jgi:murein DD-endopeptidase MepM/ murein hydrolase activator NlpD
MAHRSRLARLSAGALAVGAAAFAGVPEAAGASWRWPVRGPVIATFHVASTPFARGQHRGIDIAAPAGTPVRSACTGRVTFAGFVPIAGRTVTVRCGELAASYLHLSRIEVRRGQPVAGGRRLGAVGSSGRPRSHRPHLHLGVRRAGRRWAYVDPLLLLGDPGGDGAPPLAPAFRPRGPAPLGPAPRPLRPRLPRAAIRPVASPLPLPARVPLAAWVGLAFLSLAVPLPVMRARRRRRTAPSLKHLVPHGVPDPSIVSIRRRT